MCIRDRSLIAAPLTAFLSMVISYLVVKKRFKAKGFIEFVSMLAMAVPGTCLLYTSDYYLTKPFDMQELLAVMKTILRRRGEMIPESLNLGNISLSQADYTLRGPGKSIQLGKKEYDIMRILMVNRDMVVSKETLLSRVWGNDAEAVENNVEIYISFLRKKLDFLKADVMIVTIRKLGYRIVEKNSREVL